MTFHIIGNFFFYKERNKNDLNVRFPSEKEREKDPTRYDAWVAVCPKKRKLNKNSKICSKHFDEEDYQPGRKKLKLSAIPKLRREDEGIFIVNIDSPIINRPILSMFTSFLRCFSKYYFRRPRSFLSRFKCSWTFLFRKCQPRYHGQLSFP